MVQKCIAPNCGQEVGVGGVVTSCPVCGELLDVHYDWGRLAAGGLFGGVGKLEGFEWFLREGSGRECSGVWQFKELLPFYKGDGGDGQDGGGGDGGFGGGEGGEGRIVSVGEGQTVLQHAWELGREIGLGGERPGLYLQYEGMNPTGSFKDNGMTAGVTHARMVGAGVVACASTGNTSAAMAMYAARAGMKAVVFVGEGKIAMGKLSQALDYGALTLQVAGDFDACLARVREIASDRSNGVYLLNSVNPFRLEGQKTIMFRVLRDLGVGRGGALPDWIVVPGGNLGNSSAFGKAFMELRALGLIEKVPRLAVINARGANTLDRVYNGHGVRWTGVGAGYDRGAVEEEFARMDAAGERAETVASAIQINRPVNLPKALRALWYMDGGEGGGGEKEGVVRSVDDRVILDHKALVGRYGFGCEPASGASVAGARLLVEEGVIKPDETVVCVLTGHQLKDPDVTVGYHTGDGEYGNKPVRVADDVEEILRVMRDG